jgi:hypothetical protein
MNLNAHLLHIFYFWQIQFELHIRRLLQLFQFTLIYEDPKLAYVSKF